MTEDEGTMPEQSLTSVLFTSDSRTGLGALRSVWEGSWRWREREESEGEQGREASEDWVQTDPGNTK